MNAVKDMSRRAGAKFVAEFSGQTFTRTSAKQVGHYTHAWILHLPAGQSHTPMSKDVWERKNGTPAPVRDVVGGWSSSEALAHSAAAKWQRIYPANRYTVVAVTSSAIGERASLGAESPARKVAQDWLDKNTVSAAEIIDQRARVEAGVEAEQKQAQVEADHRKDGLVPLANTIAFASFGDRPMGMERLSLRVDSQGWILIHGSLPRVRFDTLAAAMAAWDRSDGSYGVARCLNAETARIAAAAPDWQTWTALQWFSRISAVRAAIEEHRARTGFAQVDDVMLEVVARRAIDKLFPNVLPSKPLNGTKTHPLTEAAKKVLREIARAPMPRQEVNPGVADRLCREALVEDRDLPSPYKTRKGMVKHLAITEAGQRVLNPPALAAAIGNVDTILDEVAAMRKTFATIGMINCPKCDHQGPHEHNHMTGDKQVFACRCGHEFAGPVTP
jgi:hypothetical protein